MQGEHQALLVHPFGFAKTERLSHKATQTLAQRVVEALNRVCLATSLLPWPMLPLGQSRRIRFVKVCVNKLAAIRFGNATPQCSTRFRAAIPNGSGNNLTGTKGSNKPDPAFVTLASHKTPQFIRFETIAFLRGNQRGFEGRKTICFFSSQTAMVLRLTPKIRETLVHKCVNRPRCEARS